MANRKPRPDTTKELRRRAVEMYEKGNTLAEIGQELGRSRWRICQYLEREKVPRRSKSDMHAITYDPEAFAKRTPTVAYFAGAIHARGSFAAGNRVIARASRRDQGQFITLRTFLGFVKSDRESLMLRYELSLEEGLKTWAFSPKLPSESFFRNLDKEGLAEFFFRGYWDFRVFIRTPVLNEEEQPEVAVIDGCRTLIGALAKFIERRGDWLPRIFPVTVGTFSLRVHDKLIRRAGKLALYKSEKGPRFGPIYTHTLTKQCSRLS